MLNLSSTKIIGRKKRLRYYIFDKNARKKNPFDVFVNHKTKFVSGAAMMGTLASLWGDVMFVSRNERYRFLRQI